VQELHCKIQKSNGKNNSHCILIEAVSAKVPNLDYVGTYTGIKYISCKSKSYGLVLKTNIVNLHGELNTKHTSQYISLRNCIKAQKRGLGEAPEQ
jgi:hypothetical protein